jgi:hypothetical protein
MTEREMQELLWQHPERFLNEPLKQVAWEALSDVGRFMVSDSTDDAHSLSSCQSKSS